MLSLKQRMLRSPPEKLCLGRPHHSCSFSTKFAICYCISNNRKKTKQTKKPHQPNNQKHQEKLYILILKTKPNQKPLLAFAKTMFSADHPCASHSHCISISGMEAACLMEDPHPLPKTSFSRCFIKANQSHPAWIPSTNINPLFASLPAVQSSSAGINRWEGGWWRKVRGKTHKSEPYPQFSTQT